MIKIDNVLMNWLNRKEGTNVKMYHKILKEVINKLNKYKLVLPYIILINISL